MPLEAANFLAERLFVLTLALEAALAEEDYTDAKALFQQRADVLNELERDPPTNQATLAKIEKVNKRIEASMLQKSQLLATKLRANNRGMEALKAYRGGRQLPGSSSYL